jgi:hypothetical protein
MHFASLIFWPFAYILNYYILLLCLQVFVIESDNLREGLLPIRKRVDKVQHFLEHHNGFFYILTNAPVNDTETTTKGYYLARCRAEKSLVDRWQVSLFLCGLWSI